jgi:hypothetical protein
MLTFNTLKETLFFETGIVSVWSTAKGKLPPSPFLGMT